VTLGFPQIEQRSLADQLRRCSKSICANIAEGFGKQKYSSAEYRRFLSMAVGSCNEMCVWLQYCIDLGYISPDQFEDWSSAYEVVARMIVNLIKSWQGK
jgi:four helix bundle protein